jgi:hypothetical protein
MENKNREEKEMRKLSRDEETALCYSSDWHRAEIRKDGNLWAITRDRNSGQEYRNMGNADKWLRVAAIELGLRARAENKRAFADGIYCL